MKLSDFLAKYNLEGRLIRKWTQEESIAAVQQNGYTLQYVHNQTEAICIAAVQQNGYTLRYVHNQTDAICIAAVKQNGYALQYVDVSVFEKEQNHERI